MFRKTSGAILCPSCGKLTNADASVCLICGRRNPGMWGWAGPLGAIFRHRSFTSLVTALCIALYVVSLIFDPLGALRPRGPFDIFSPTQSALYTLGMTSGSALAAGEWWTLVTAIYLHGNLLHILFNVLWIRQLGPAVEELYGPARFFVIFTIAGVAGFLVSDFVTGYPTVGASGSIFGLLGAMVAFGRRRGGVFGRLVIRQYGQWALLLFVMGFVMSSVNNFAHAGGFVGGLLAGLALSFEERRAESGADRFVAAICVVITIAGFGLALWTTFANR